MLESSQVFIYTTDSEKYKATFFTFACTNAMEVEEGLITSHQVGNWGKKNDNFHPKIYFILTTFWPEQGRQRYRRPLHFNEQHLLFDFTLEASSSRSKVFRRKMFLSSAFLPTNPGFFSEKGKSHAKWWNFLFLRKGEKKPFYSIDMRTASFPSIV